MTVGTVGGLAFGPGITAPTIGGLAGSGNVNLATTDASPLPVVLTIGGNSSTTYSGALSGSGGLTLAGAAALVLTGSNTYSGQTTISSGTLQLGGGGATGSINSANITDNGVLEFDRSDSSLTFSQAVSGSGGLVKAGTGTLILTGANTYTGATRIIAGTLQVGYIVTPTAPPPSILHYDFASLGGVGTSVPNGTTVPDVSGNGNTGTMVAAAPRLLPAMPPAARASTSTARTSAFPTLLRSTSTPGQTPFG